MKSITKQKWSFNLKLTKITPLIALVFLISCTPEWEENGFPNEQSYTSAIDKGFDSLNDWESFSDGNFDNKGQWSFAMEAGFISKKEFLEAAKYSVYTKDAWMAEIDKSNTGGFYTVGFYFKAKELGISTQKELSKYEYDEMQVLGMRSAGKGHAYTEKCALVSQFLVGATKNNMDRLLFSNMTLLFRTKNEAAWAEINERPMNKEETTAFNKAKNSENMGWNTKLNNMTGNQKKLMDYFTAECMKMAVNTCDIARSMKQESLVYQCNKLSKYGL